MKVTQIWKTQASGSRFSKPAKQVGTSRVVGAKTGFSLIVTITIMILLSLIAVGLLTLSTTTLRAANASSAKIEAEANARLALSIAIGELQKALGADQRITADASITMAPDEESENAHVLGVWNSWSPKLSKNVTGGAPDYEQEKTQQFAQWLISGVPEEVNSLEWIETAGSESSTSLFTESRDGFDLKAPLVDIEVENYNGSLAWAVVQENTKAKISVAGPEDQEIENNDSLAVQPRPNASLEGVYQQPSSDWNKRAAKISSLQQARLDPELGATTDDGVRSDIYTTHSFGLLTDVVDGGLKVDLSLGLGLDDEDFESESWSSEQNPFHSSSEEDFDVPGAYGIQRPLYEPQSDSGNVIFTRDNFAPANIKGSLPVAAVPTFQSLRSFYQIPNHLYQSSEGLTVFEREAGHIACKIPNSRGGTPPPPAATVNDFETTLPIRPILDRAMFVVSAGLASDDKLRLFITPFVVLWNPYNVALEIEGSVAYIWLDIPYRATWEVRNRGSNERFSSLVSPLMGLDTGRSVNPYFYAAITATGQSIGTGTATPISFQPGEVRIFAPASQTPVEYDPAASIRDRTVFLSPIESLDQYSTKGGLSVPTFNPRRNKGFQKVMTRNESTKFTFEAVTSQAFPFAIALEDATRAKGTNPGIEDRGQALTEIIASTFTETGDISELSSGDFRDFSELKNEPFMVGVLECVRRVALGSSPSADLVFTGNPRQPWMNPFITDTSFSIGPQYVVRMREEQSIDNLVQNENGGRNAYYGLSNGSNGSTHLSFFGIPSQPILSLAEFQSADLSSTPFAPANQFGNSWASAYVSRNQVSDTINNGDVEANEVDHCYLLNEALWDRYFLSGASPTLSHSSNTGSTNIWENEIAQEEVSTEKALEDFVENPSENPLRNPRMKFYRGGLSDEEFVSEMTKPEGCVKLAKNLLVDGAFNVNSTSIEAWKAFLGGLQGAKFDLADGSPSDSGDNTPFPRFKVPAGEANDNWQGFRTLSDEEITTLATSLVTEVRSRGPFLSLAEFINRRVSNDQLGLKGALQAAIDNSSLNESVLGETQSFNTSKFERGSQSNISPANTGVGIPGYLTQADLLKSIAPVITVRSDTFIVRAYGTSKSNNGRIEATATIEAVVQRVPDFLDSNDSAETPLAELSETNQTFGRRLKVVSVRFLSERELQATTQS